MKPFGLFFLLSVLAFIDELSADRFTSLEKVTEYIKTEEIIIEYLKEFLQKQRDKISNGEKIIKEYELFAKEGKKNPKNFMGNPVNAYLLIKHLTRDFFTFLNSFNANKEASQYVTRIKSEQQMPPEDDYMGSVMALYNIEKTYSFNPSDIKEGILKKYKSIRPLKAKDYFDLGRAIQTKEPKQAVRWFSQSLELAELEGPHCDVDKSLVLILLADSAFKAGNIYNAIEITKTLIKINPKHPKGKENLKKYAQALADNAGESNDMSESIDIRNLARFKNNQPEASSFEMANEYERLCRNKIPKKSVKKSLSQLKCRLFDHIPSMKLSPIKAEMVSLDPKIWMLHDILSPSQSERMIELARPRLERSKIKNPETQQAEVSDQRISQTAWLNNGEDPVLVKLEGLISSMLRMNLKTADNWQVNNYGLGGLYLPHVDFNVNGYKSPLDIEHGPRTVTWIFYNEVPRLGGAVVFPKLGLRVKPSNRSALFWFNYRSGKPDPRTLHGDCPVLIGSKWVTNKWIRAKH